MRLESFLNSLFEVLVVVIFENFKALDNWIKFSDESSMFSGTQPLFILVGNSIIDFTFSGKGHAIRKKLFSNIFALNPFVGLKSYFGYVTDPSLIFSLPFYHRYVRRYIV